MNKRRGPILFSEHQPFSGLQKAYSRKPEEVLQEVQESRVRGRGGAGFPVAGKWRFALTEYGKRPPEERYVICNADEGEPGTFKDRVLLTEYPELLFEGMLIAGYALGAANGIVYLRGEYLYMWDDLQAVLRRMKKEGRLGGNLDGRGFSFGIRIRMGAGAYVCGEETALIESLEGFRGEPRNRPPYPVNVGFRGRPTVVNNVETLCLIPHILNHGAEWFSAIGTRESTGSKLLSVSGDVQRPGVYEVPFGTPVRDVLELADAREVKAVQVGGASGICLSSCELGRRICFEDVSTGGSFMVFNKTRSLREVLRNFLEFFMEESCGQCAPCRYGNECLLDGLSQLESGEKGEDYLRELCELCETMQLASKCGLGQSVANPFLSIVRNFREELLAPAVSGSPKTTGVHS